MFISINREDIFQSVNNKTWIEEKRIEGTSLIFHEADSKFKKAIRQ